MDWVHHPCCIPLTKEFPKLTYDELLPYEDILDVTRLDHKCRLEHPASILEAARSMRLTKSECKTPTSYAIRLSGDLDKAFSIPNEVETIDLYSSFWPHKEETSYLKNRGKLFQGFQRGYKSLPTMSYAGTSQWVHVISGAVTYHVYKPTPRNMALASPDFEGRRGFKADHKTAETFRLQENQGCLIIPTGWISRCTAEEGSFVISGEFLHCQDFTNQLRNFERDVMMSNGFFAIDRDRELRFLYWFTAAQLLQDTRLKRLNVKDLESLKEFLSDWRKRFKMITNPPNLYAPTGLNLDVIIRDIGKSLKSAKNSVNVLMNQTSTHNEAN